MSPRLRCLLLPLSASLLLPHFASSAISADRPNIVWIVSEDNSKHYLKLFDPEGTETPNIEALAREGITFTRAFSNAPVCSVARTTLATGCYAPRLGTMSHRRLEPAKLPEGLRLFSGLLREAGYYTSNNSKEDYNTAKDPAAWDDSSKKASWRNRPDPAQPFFHMESHAESHESSLHFDPGIMATEMTAHDPDKVTLPPYFPDTPLFRYTKARYLDRIRLIDDIVGATVAKLEADGLLDDTIIFYFGDHGGVLPRSKGYLYETGLHVPLVIRIPEKWQYLSPLAPGSSSGAFVSFIDFGPTVLHLAGVKVPDLMDGRPFLGEGITPAGLATRDSAFGSSDRFDEKYDLSRSLRKGDWKYVRNYQPYQPEALQNNYRYQMAAYREWRDLYDEGRLGADQRAFFEAKSPEALYDLANDPHETRNLAADPAHRDRLLAMRNDLRERLKAMPDLGFYPESVLVAEAMNDPVAWGRARAPEIAALIDTADLMLAPCVENEEALRVALKSENASIRFLAATVCSAYGVEATELIDAVRPLLRDAHVPVRIRAAEFLGLAGAIDPRPALVGIHNGTDDPVERLIALQSAALFHEHAPVAHPFEATAFTPAKPGSEGERRLVYFAGEWLGSPKGKAKEK
ncbi:MAG: sulfatase-like hydrolase/transferase [Verrucomicrobiales bacterium]|nr:sulfatase-like hydrolase/transferase [Verrucomicrobiales bacterium]